MDLAVRYTISEDIIYDPDKGEKTILGVTKIKDPMLLEEMIQYRSQPSSSKGIHAINVDRIISFYHCLILANHQDKYIPLSNWVATKEIDTNSSKKQYLDTGFGAIYPKNTNPFKGISTIPTRGIKFPGMR